MRQTEKVLQLLQDQGVLRPHELKAYGISPIALYTLYRQGRVMRTGRGLYSLPDGNFTEHHSLAESCKRVPQGIVCLLSALCFHNIGTQNPFEVWLAIDRKARYPQVDYPPLRIMRFSGEARTTGVEVHLLEGVSVKVYDQAKTVVDCFKYRNKIGLDLCLEALTDGLRRRKFTVNQLIRYAKICRMENVMRPYVEAVLAVLFSH